MNINSQLSNSSLLRPDVSIERYQKQSKHAVVDGSSSAGSEGVASQSKQESIDQVHLSPAARQAYEASTIASEDTGKMIGLKNPEGGQDQGETETGSNVTTNSPIDAYQKQADAAEDGNDKGDSEASNGNKPQNTTNSADSTKLSAEAQQQLLELQQRDREVQVHEAAHAAVGGQYAGAPSLSYETGPDGKRYAVSGEVNIDMSEIPGDPAATMKKADIIHAAALAPAQPSSQDRNIAGRASQMKAKAQAELMAETAKAGNEMVENSLAADTGTAAADKISAEDNVTANGSGDNVATSERKFAGAVA